MSEPSIEEIVARLEAAPHDEGRYTNRIVSGAHLRALIADWRKRGEATKAVGAALELVLDKVAGCHDCWEISSSGDEKVQVDAALKLAATR